MIAPLAENTIGRNANARRQRCASSNHTHGPPRSASNGSAGLARYHETSMNYRETLEHVIRIRNGGAD